jgi:hypothetical protein
MMDEQTAYETGRKSGLREATLARDIERIYAVHSAAAFIHTLLAAVGLAVIVKVLYRGFRRSRV